MLSKTLLTTCFILTVHFAIAQEKLAIVIRNDSVFSNNVLQFTTRSKTSAEGVLIASLTAPDGKLQAVIQFTSKKDTTKFSARFYSINVGYNCLYPPVSLATICESYIQNKVMVNGIAVKEGLKAYCDERKIPLLELTQRRVQRPGMDAARDSDMVARAKAMLALKVIMPVKNNSKNPVRIFSGYYDAQSKSKMPQGRSEILNAGEEKNITGFIGEKICIQTTDSTNLMQDCKPVLKEMKAMQITADGLHLLEQ